MNWVKNSVLRSKKLNKRNIFTHLLEGKIYPYRIFVVTAKRRQIANLKPRAILDEKGHLTQRKRHFNCRVHVGLVPCMSAPVSAIGAKSVTESSLCPLSVECSIPCRRLPARRTIVFCTPQTLMAAFVIQWPP